MRRDSEEYEPRETRSPKDLQRMVLDYLDERFGLEEKLFEKLGLYLASKGRVYLGPKSAIAKPRVVTLGLLIARISGAVKPSTNLLQVFGKKVTKNFIELTKEQTIVFANGSDVNVEQNQLADASEGYVLLRYHEAQLGCGLLKGKSIKNMLPKAKRLEIKYI